MKYLKNKLPIFIVLLFLVISKNTQAQKFYYFENVKTGKSYRMNNQNISFKTVVYNPESNISRIYKVINCIIDSSNGNTLYIKKAYERIEIFFSDGKIQKTENTFLTKEGSVKCNGIDTININDMIEVKDYSGVFDRHKFVRVATQVFLGSLGLVTVIGPFVFNEYFKVVGISFVSSIPIFISSAILQNKYILKGKKPNDKVKWKLVYR